MRRQISYLGALLSLGLSLALPRPAAAQANDPRLEKIFQDWARRQQAVRSIRYRVEGEEVYPKGSQNEILLKPSKNPFPSQDITCALKRTLLIDFSTGRYRLDLDEESYTFNTTGGPGNRTQGAGTTLFDGSVVKHVTQRDPKNRPAGDQSSRNPDMTVEEGDLKNEAFMSSYWPFFVGHGIISNMYHEIAPGTLMDKPDIELFYIHGQGVHQGRPCLVVRSHPQRQNATIDELWVDPARESAILRQLQASSDGRPLTESDIQYQQTSHGWLPRSWIYTLRSGGRKITRQERLRVVELELDCAASNADFTPEEWPGMLIVKKRFGKPVDPVQPRILETEERLYRVNDSGSKFEVVFENGVERRRWAQPWLWWLLGAPIAALVGWFIYRRRTLNRIAPGKGENHAT